MEPVSQQLIQKFLRGECTPEEERQVIGWYNTFDDRPDAYALLSVGQRNELYNRMLGNIQQSINNGSEKHRSKVTLRTYWIAAGMAAALLCFFAITGLLNTHTSGREASQYNPYWVVTNNTQTIYRHVLPDKSIVWLSPAAQISYRRKFKPDKREIKLTGEAFFEVTKNKAWPFVVYSNRIITRVWGTSFRVHDIAAEQASEVAVVTGKVSVHLKAGVHQNNNKTVSERDNGVMLLPAQRAVFQEGVKSLQVKRVSQNSSLHIWQKTSLSFNKVPLGSALRTLNRAFHVNIILEDEKLQGLLLQADFTDQSLPDILEMLKKLLHITYVTNGTKFEFNQLPTTN